MKNLSLVCVALATYLLASCQAPSTSPSSSSSSSGGGGTTAAPALTNCTTSLIDTGQKGNVAAVVRGLYSDTKMIPGTTNPSTAFVDQFALVIKFSYYNGSEFVTEPVASDGTGAFVRLAYQTNGIPMVFWTFGTNLKVAIRSAAPGTAGTWNAGVIDTGVAPRAVEVSVNPLNQVIVGFMTDTATTGHPKFVYCSSSCTSASAFQTMTPNPYIENSAITAAQTAIGVAWCQASASTYYPALAYSANGATHYATCLNTLPNCLNSANWTTSNIAATTSVSNKLLIDPTIVGDVPKAMFYNGSGVTPYIMGTTACSSAPVAFTAGTSMGTANSGTNWMTVLKDSTGKFHLMANESTTAVKYYNSTSTTFTGAWNASSAVETTTLASPAGSGADIDNTTDGIYTSYGITVAPYDIHMSRVENYTTSSAAALFSTFVPDGTGNMQMNYGMQRNIAAAATSGGTPAVAYVDFSVGSATNEKLKYAIRSGSTSTSPWDWNLVPDTLSPEFPSLVLDSNNEVWIGFFDASTNKFYLANNGSSLGTGSWSIFQFPLVPSGAPVGAPAANHTALAMINGNPMLITIDNNATSKGVHAAIFNSSTRVWSTPVTVDALTTGAAGAAFLSADSDSNGNVVIAYQDLSLAKVKYAYTNGGSTWSTPLAVSQVNQGPGTTIKINPANDQPTIAYYDQVNNYVIYNACSNSIANCASSGWSPTTIENAAGVSGLPASTFGLLSAALEFATDGTAYILYPRGISNDGNLIMWNNAGGQSETTKAAYGTNGSLSGAPNPNYAVAGWDVATTRNAAGGVTAAYVGPGDWLYATSCGD